MRLRQLWKLLSGAALLVSGLLVGTSAPAGASTGGCAGDVVVALDVAVWARPGHDTYGFSLSEPLPAGVWSVQVRSSDAYAGRSASEQPHEQWVLDITDHTILGPTSDLEDGVEAASALDQLGSVVSNQGISHFTVRHSVASVADGTQSVTAECVGFTLLESPGDGIVATAGVDCAAGVVRVGIHNSGALAGHYEATAGSGSASGTLASGAEADLVFDITDDLTEVVVSTDSHTILDEALATDCSPPSPTTTAPPSTTVPPATTVPPPSSVPPTTVVPTVPPPTTVPTPTTSQPTVPPSDLISAQIRASAVVDCVAEEVLVLLGNAGDLAVTVDVALPLSEVRSAVALAGGSTTTSTLAISGLDDGITEIRVSDSVTGETYLRTPVDVDCQDPGRPTATTVLDCPGGVVVVHLGNEAGDSITLTVLHERVELVAEVVLAAGEVAEVEIPIAGAATIPIRVVDDDGNDIVRLVVDNVCEPIIPAEADDGASGATAESVDAAPVIVAADCAAVEFSSADRFDVAVELDGTILLDGTANGATRIPVVPGVPTRIIVSAPGDNTPTQLVTPAGLPCADIRVVISPDCVSMKADVSVRRDGVGRERFVILVGGRVAGVLAIDGTGSGAVPVSLGTGSAELSISRSMAAEPIVVGTISCARDKGLAGPVAASFVVFAVLATAAGVLPWPPKLLMR